MKEERDVSVKEEQEEIVAKQDVDVDVEEEQETSLSPEQTSLPPKPIQTRINPKQTHRSLRGCRQAKRKAAIAISPAVDNEDYEGDVAEVCREDYELVINDCSNSAEIQEPKKKKAIKNQDKLDKQWFNCS